ncbi:hypothetical protein SAMN05421837_106193 [Amycolatopsis pretoriensis]|uniref:Uncharacterized protein n=1 Tax=Amycolatopsis pretoriensis TaxID=218821 RepID=A0A1H5R1V0_9PSEU|nr:hypothetical protein [Amycolatopsis pretoriensis]SEF32363.1 hypothetical protein SAMN05421837_106193 [Amycolatopsis pretoriensis]
MTTPPPGPPTDPAALAYPNDSDATVRKAANFIGAHGIVTLLDKLRIFVAGDIGRVIHLAETFAVQRSLPDAVAQLNQAQLDLSTAWQGDAAEQFTTYVGMAKPVLTQNQTSMQNLTKTMSSIASSIIDTYKNLITAIGRCAINISQLGGKIGIAIAESTVLPPLAPIKISDIADALNTAFATFWNDCLTLLTGMMTTIARLVENQIDLRSIEANFTSLPDVGSSAAVIDDPTRWRVKPGASHP